MKTIAKYFVATLAITAVTALFPACSCGDDDGSGAPDAADVDSDPGIDADPNAFPMLGTQIDRAGRAAITTALVATFRYTDDNDRNGTKDAYNADDNVAGWVAAHEGEIADQLGVLDGINNVCGDQLLFDGGGTNYAPLAALLADDVLQVNVTTTTCDVYLGVELGAVGDCGGRTPLIDVVDASYGVLAGDNSGGPAAPISDNVALDAGGTHNTVTFPFLGAPLSI